MDVATGRGTTGYVRLQLPWAGLMRVRLDGGPLDSQEVEVSDRARMVVYLGGYYMPPASCACAWAWEQGDHDPRAYARDVPAGARSAEHIRPAPVPPRTVTPTDASDG